MAILSAVGRACFASLFIMGGIMKLQQFDINDGGQMMTVVQPKLDVALQAVHGHIPQFDVELIKGYYPQMLLAAVVLELFGGILFVFNSSIGAVMLLTFLGSVTPVMHAFWDVDEDAMKQSETIQFFKNLMLVGALLFYLGMKRV